MGFLVLKRLIERSPAEFAPKVEVSCVGYEAEEGTFEFVIAKTTASLEHCQCPSSLLGRRMESLTLYSLLEELCEEKGEIFPRADTAPVVLALALFRRQEIPRIENYVGVTDRFLAELEIFVRTSG